MAGFQNEVGNDDASDEEVRPIYINYSFKFSNKYEDRLVQYNLKDPN